MRKLIATAALAGSLAAGLALTAPAAQAATATTDTASQSVHKWGKFYSNSHKAYTFGYTWKSHGRVYTKWYGKESTPRSGYVWFRYEFKGGGGGKFFRPWDGSHSETWSKKGLSRVYTYTCWGGKFNDCGKVYRIY